jgi:hypothetical protein
MFNKFTKTNTPISDVVLIILSTAAVDDDDNKKRDEFVTSITGLLNFISFFCPIYSLII